ncbi:Coiled-coil domain-containing protein 68 [Saguinus oedipus]|uniref:Coiled-coil domain-containing protein 68 n=1 Tax=Saguinus oedipus TaxID=9490 RepID=A0ABQ9UCH4_SAGOE|nr:Coiled-coil domain-containing protein 68 [Saguinus oedipus]
MDPSCCNLDSLMKKMKGKDLQLLEMNKENEVLKIKLEASREAGAAALRDVARRLFENYQTQSEEVRKKHEDSKHLLQVPNTQLVYWRTSPNPELFKFIFLEELEMKQAMAK